MKKAIYITLGVSALIGICLFGQTTFDRIPFSTEMYSTQDPFGKQAIGDMSEKLRIYGENVTFNTSSQSIIIRTCDTNNPASSEEIEHYVEQKSMDGVTIDAPFGAINFFTDEAEGRYDKIFINGMSLKKVIAMANNNPLYGKKLTIIGDSQSCTPSRSDCYAGLIAKRNNMVYVNKGVGGTALASQVTKPSTGEVFPAIIDSYVDDIPPDTDFILIQAGYNDRFDGTVSDESLDRSTFKGCWNLLLTDLKTRYPNASCGIMLPYSWITSRVERVEWMKTRCDKYGYEYFDQTPLFSTNQVQYFESGVAFAVHLSTVGARKVSYPIEEWMKTTMNIYNDNLYK
jgi:hypothetical protein